MSDESTLCANPDQLIVVATSYELATQFALGLPRNRWRYASTMRHVQGCTGPGRYALVVGLGSHAAGKSEAMDVARYLDAHGFEHVRSAAAVERPRED